MIRVFLGGLAIVGMANVASAGPARLGTALTVSAFVQAAGWKPLNGGTMMVIGVPALMKAERVVCADAVLGCEYGAGPRKPVLPWDLRRAGKGVALTIRGANISIQRGGLNVSKSMTFSVERTPLGRWVRR
jgi:hypothetical protein